ncbi:SMP-30/gluconolactonase/LRE family protein [Lederbergia citrea]|uniref:SMP-30/gluconolactonase/LRE family protein n=1 Tax=Lederbergia citrea TaxID=2833581 RepID=UPI001BC9F680|nr:SMP-30/gluconolactonase/LRE family protein [Lederbergia citrea]
MIDKSQIEIFASGLDHPEGLVFDRNGDLYCGGELGQIYRICPKGKVTEICRVGGLFLGMAFGPDDYLYVCNEDQRKVFKISKDGNWEVFATGVDGEPFILPNMVAFDNRGRLYISDSGDLDGANGRIYRFTLDGRGEPFSKEMFCFANGIAWNHNYTELYIVESQANRVVAVPLLDNDNAGKSRIIIEGLERFPDGISIDSKGNFYITCYATNRIYIVDKDTREKKILIEDPEAQIVASPTNCVLAGKDESVLYYAQLNARFIGKVKIR